MFLMSFFFNSEVILKTAQRRKKSTKNIYVFDDIALGDFFLRHKERTIGIIKKRTYKNNSQLVCF